MADFPKLALPPITLRVERSGKELRVLDAVRGMWLKLTPEEWVRRHVIGWLVGRGVAPQQIVQEYPVALNGQPQRADLVVMDQQARPWLLVECKAADIPLSQSVLDQAARYNSIVQAPYLLITNGIRHACYAFADNRYRPLESLPSLQQSE